MKLLFTDPFFFGNGSAGGYLFVGFYAVICILIVASYFLRAIPPFSWIWWFVKWFTVYMFVRATVNFTKKEVKSWWSKD